MRKEIYLIALAGVFPSIVAALLYFLTEYPTMSDSVRGSWGDGLLAAFCFLILLIWLIVSEDNKRKAKDKEQNQVLLDKFDTVINELQKMNKNG